MSKHDLTPERPYLGPAPNKVLSAIAALKSALAETAPDWLPMCTAPKDGTLVLLLVDFDTHATADGLGPHMTIGSNTSENDKGPDEWQFAGWDWCFDTYTQATGTPVGWLPMPSHAAPVREPAPVQEPVAEIYAPSYLPRAIGLRFTHYGTTLPAGTKLYAAPVREPAPVLEKKGLFVDLIAQHPGLAEELAAMDVPAPVQEPVKVGCLRCNTPKKCDVWGCSPNTFPSEQPAPPADVPMLSTQERLNIITQFTIAGTLGDLIVHVEKLVRQKAGLP